MPARPSSIIEPRWDQFVALLPDRMETHPLGCHRPRIPDRVVLDTLVQVLVFGCASHRIADATVAVTTLRRRRDAWIAAGVMATVLDLVLGTSDRMIGLDLDDIAIDCCITKAPWGGEMAGRSPVDRGSPGLKRSLAVDAAGIPLGTVAAPANRHDSPLRAPTLAVLGRTDATMTIHLDRGDDSARTRQCLTEHGLRGEIAARGKPARIAAGKRGVVERTIAWTNAHTKRVWCTERRAAVIAFWIAFSAAIIIMGRLVRSSGACQRADRSRRKTEATWSVEAMSGWTGGCARLFCRHHLRTAVVRRNAMAPTIERANEASDHEAAEVTETPEPAQASAEDAGDLDADPDASRGSEGPSPTREGFLARLWHALRGG